MAQQPITFKSWRDLPLMCASQGNTSVMKTGSWRNVEPHHVEQISPCSFRCPAGNDVVGFVTHAAEGRFEEAWRILAQTSPFPGTCGRICPHPCEDECNRKPMGAAINIHTIERYLADRFRDSPPQLHRAPLTGKKAAVIGSGPAGLSCAYQLALAGHDVVVYEAHSKPGGMLRVGIPDYRLPPSVLDGEIDRIANLGVRIITNTRVGKDVMFDDIVNMYDVVFAASGLTSSRPLGAKGDDGAGIIPGIEVLRRINLGEDAGIGDNVLVVGGGNTAMDVARSVLRLGKKVRVIYRRTRAEMPAIAEEIDELIAEGIDIQFLATPTEVLYNKGKLTGVRCIRMELGKPDNSGRRRPEPVQGSEFVIDADTILTAIGETADLSYLPKEMLAKTSWNIPADELGRTFDQKLYAGGDVADGAGTVTAAIGFGRRAAIAINAALTGKPLPTEAAMSPSLRERENHVVRFEEINTAYFDEILRKETISLPVEERIDSFDEVRCGYNEAEVVSEASRCFSCGTCPACDNCLIFCPDVAISRAQEGSGELYLVDTDYCKGCGLCAAECPRACIVMRSVR